MSDLPQFRIRTVALFCRFQRSTSVASAVIDLVKCLLTRKIAILTNEETVGLSGIRPRPEVSVRPIDDIAEADLAVIVGGDGTFINLARRIAPQGVPLLGINLGRVGFLTDVNVRGMVESMAEVLEGGFSVEERMMLDVRPSAPPPAPDDQLAVNDVALSRGADGRIIEVSISINGSQAFQLRGDGAIFSTPTGSTAYAMAAGGPIIAPDLHSISIVPLNAYSLTLRPLAVSPDSVISVKLIKGQGTLVHLDGSVSWDVHEGDTITISRYRTALRVVHPLGYDFYQNLRQKLHWAR